MGATKALEPPDPKRCQTVIRPAYSPFDFGKKYPERCKNTPTVIAFEATPGDDGLTGSMSLCTDCHETFERQRPGYATYEKVEDYVERLARMTAAAKRLGAP